MTNNDIFKKLRVALQLRDDQIVEILQLVDFRISKAEIGSFFRNEDHPKYMECGDQILRNFLNGLVIYLRGTKENPKDPKKVLEQIKQDKKPLEKPKTFDKPKPTNSSKSKPQFKPKKKKPESPVQFTKFNNGKHKKKDN
ncbi:MAG: DUF1456 family protein [Flavobacteriales bacterium]|nr:DUF1456 family protein [Flavobacteriales bacterium]